VTEGGAVLIIDYSTYSHSPNCKFINNTALNGGALAIRTNSKYTDSPNCVFKEN
jgi:predicted outer membrane repeat protein